MKTSQNLRSAYDLMAGTLARSGMQCQARGCDGGPQVRARCFRPESDNGALAILPWAVAQERRP